MSYLSSSKTPQNHLWSLFLISGSAIAIEEFSNSTSDSAGTHDKTAGQPFCTAKGCPQGGAQGGAL